MRYTTFAVGLLYGIIGTLHTRELDQFLCAHRQVHWIDVISTGALASDGCRDLVADHLYDYHSEPVDTRRLAVTLGDVHGWAGVRIAKPFEHSQDTRQMGASSAMLRMRTQIARVARTSGPCADLG